jgi:hypothetical protein
VCCGHWKLRQIYVNTAQVLPTRRSHANRSQWPSGKVVARTNSPRCAGTQDRVTVPAIFEHARRDTMGFPVECWDAGEKKPGKCYLTTLFCSYFFLCHVWTHRYFFCLPSHLESFVLSLHDVQWCPLHWVLGWNTAAIEYFLSPFFPHIFWWCIFNYRVRTLVLVFSLFFLSFLFGHLWRSRVWILSMSLFFIFIAPLHTPLMIWRWIGINPNNYYHYHCMQGFAANIRKESKGQRRSICQSTFIKTYE